MTTIDRNENSFVVPVELLSKAFGISEAAVRHAMWANTLTSQSETGVGEDEGRWRLTFFFEHGQVLKRASFPVRRRAAPTPASPKEAGKA